MHNKNFNHSYSIIFHELSRDKKLLDEIFEAFDRWEKELELHLQGKIPYPKFEI